MSPTPRLSVVVPAYNNGRTLAETLRSILDQDVPGLEVVVADHASGAGCKSILWFLLRMPILNIIIKG